MEDFISNWWFLFHASIIPYNNFRVFSQPIFLVYRFRQTISSFEQTSSLLVLCTEEYECEGPNLPSDYFSGLEFVFDGIEIPFFFWYDKANLQ